ncbi:P24 [Lonomia obliqua multiple nucleopolyhedrovirus]|uniref:p24 n=1 Tax=Lonomia obliqua multiple nucleopolyhedrovirus TaxID=134394 RepID=A0A126FCA0_9ABAC|nr:P24 [Lonomia obliqua multiple nucleopolyhedrovirus]AKN81030.1 P24 [Lonomia obliqua multiple nucleopolyhedrovirus]
MDHFQTTVAPLYETQNFNYSPNKTLEVVIITNSAGDHDGYLELTAATKIMSPFLSNNNNNSSALWTSVAPSHKLMKNNKNYIHVFSLFKHLSNYNLNNKNHPPEYYTVKSLICDLLMGMQSKQLDPLCEIKTQLCAIQESLNESIVILNNHVTANNTNISLDFANKLQETIKTQHLDSINKLTFGTETILESIKTIKDIMCLSK